MQEGLRWAGFTRTGRYILVQNHDTSSGDRELVRYLSDFSNRTVISNEVEHGDLGIDDNGDDIFVMIAWDYLYYVRVKDGIQVNFGLTDQSRPMGHGHISCRAIHRPGWCYFSSGNNSRLGAVKLGLDGLQPYTDDRGREAYRGLSEAEFWGFHRSSENSYNVSPKASVSPSGTKLMYTSDWYETNEVNSYILEYLQ